MNTQARRLLGLVTILLLASTQSVPAAGDPPATTGPFAVIVGAGKFSDPAIDARPTADNDARLLYDLLTDSRFFTLGADRAKLFLSSPDETRNARIATRDAILAAVEAAISRTSRDDLLILAFFGRGATVDEKSVFLTPESQFHERSKTALFLGDDLAPAFAKLKGQKILMMMDVHYKGFRSGNETILEPTLMDVDPLFAPAATELAPGFGDRVLLLSGYVNYDPIDKGELGQGQRAL